MRTKWGQNFLVGDATARRIVDALAPRESDAVVEIGPGRGALTLHLLPLVRSLTVVELDRRLAETLKARWGYHPHFHVVAEDFLSWTPPGPSVPPAKLIGNLPYSAAAAILQRALAWDGWDRAVFMVQKEVAERITAVPGGKEWGLLALSVQSRAAVRRLFHVPPGAFRPAPKVMSTVVELSRLTPPPVTDLDVFVETAHGALGQRPNNLPNRLSHG